MDREFAAVLVEEYLAGSTMRKVAAHHGTSTKLVQRAMRQLGAATRSPEERAVTRHKWSSGPRRPGGRHRGDRRAVRGERADGSPAAAPARGGGCSSGPARRQQRKRDERTIRELIDRYVAGETLAELGRDLGVSAARVQQLMRDSGAPLETLTPRHTAARSQLRDRSDRATVNDAMATNPTLSIRELAAALGMAPGRVKRLLDPQAPARRRPPRAPVAQRPADPLLAAIRACAKASGVARREPLSAASYEAWVSEREGMPSRAVLVRRFGSWANAVEAAGYQPAVKPRRSYRRLSHTDAVATVGAFVLHERAQGRPPSSRHYPQWARQHGAPSLAGLGLYWRWSHLVSEALASLAEPEARS